MRPILRYHGGKWMIAPWIISHFPDHRVYVEPYGGAASVLLRKKNCYCEVYNELDEEIVNVFRVMQYRGKALKRVLSATSFSRREFIDSYKPTTSKLERARRTIIKSFMGYGSDSIRRKSGFRNDAKRSGTTPAHDWKNYADCLDFLIDRLRGVIIESKPALEIIDRFDSPDTLFYIDPPYVHSTRSAISSKAYRFEMTDQDHRDLSEKLKKVKGKVLISGYDSDLYNELYAGWRKENKATHADGGRDRTECIWQNYAPNPSET